MKRILFVAAMFFTNLAFANEDFITTNYGFATEGYNFYVDETGFIVSKFIETNGIYINGHPIGVKGSDLPSQSNIELGWEGDFFHVNGTSQADTLADTFSDGQKVTVYFVNNPIIKHGMASSYGKSGMRLKGSIDAAGPILIGFIKDGNVWVETHRTQF